MKVSRAGYYAWAARKSCSDEREASIRAAVTEKFYFHRRRYGAKRLSGELKDSGIKAGRYLVSRVMREEGLAAKQPKRFKPRTTDSKGTRRPSPNLLKDAAKTGLVAGEAIVGETSRTCQ